MVFVISYSLLFGELVEGQTKEYRNWTFGVQRKPNFLKKFLNICPTGLSHGPAEV
jgi:hypothetical protein